MVNGLHLYSAFLLIEFTRQSQNLLGVQCRAQGHFDTWSGLN